MQIRIRSISANPEFILHFDVGSSVALLRQTISKEMSIALESFYLCYDQEMLEDQNTLEDYGVQEDAVIFCVVKPVTDNSLVAKLEDGTTFEVNFHLSDTVQKIKRIISERAFGKRCRLSMLHNGNVMSDAKELKEYHLKTKEEICVTRSYV
eukprot:TRINITY_DN2960_c0_g1_i1.p1 TRINITY_DN2960_c0_g1~~TRINITY_DN2960_c0_g1_i1.p1  ORF type:complete len:152 (-),score=15.45 TRINITY_DN2960_c0_g1_i1:14-469(-)